MAPLPDEVCSGIIQYIHHSPDLLALCCVCKAFNRVAEAKLYEYVILRDPEETLLACQSLNARNGRLGTYVRQFWVVQDRKRMRDAHAPISRYIWEEVRLALTNMINLEVMHIQDPTMDNSWILTPFPKFQLHEASIGFVWDQNVVAFLQTQSRIVSLHSMDSIEDGPPLPIPRGTLPELESYNGPILIANELFGCPLVHLQVLLDEESAPLLLNVLSNLMSMRKLLRSINIVGLPEDVLVEALQLFSKASFNVNLRFLGLLPLPVPDVSLLFLLVTTRTFDKMPSAPCFSRLSNAVSIP